MTNRILAEVDPSGPRRWLGVGLMLALGGLLLYVAFSTPPAVLFWQVFLVVLGLFALYAAHRVQKATTARLLLTEDALTDSNGTLIARVEDIVAVDRGMLAMKPSNGFMIKLREPLPRAWHPGLWWRLGRRVAIGGVTSGRQTKPMADALSVMLARREAKETGV